VPKSERDFAKCLKMSSGAVAANSCAPVTTRAGTSADEEVEAGPGPGSSSQQVNIHSLITTIQSVQNGSCVEKDAVGVSGVSP
jgi:hypothetical protein